MEESMNVALQEGFFAKRGLKVQPVYGIASTPAAVAAMTGGSLDIIPSNGDNLYIEVAQGIDLQAIAAASGQSMVLVGNIDAAPFPQWVKELEGKTVAVTAPGASSDLWVKALLKKAGVPESKVHFATASGATALGLYKAGRIDAWAGTDPAASQFVASGAHVLTRFGADPNNPEGPLTVQLCRQALRPFIASHPKQIQAFVAGLEDAVTFIQNPANNAKVADDVKKVAQVDMSTVPDAEAGWEKMIDDYRPRQAVVNFTAQDLAEYLTYVRQYETGKLAGTKFATGDPVQVTEDAGLVWSGAPH
jgi:NitT/TauT family transport system substrate-binding protein